MKRKALFILIPLVVAGLAGCQKANPDPTPDPTEQCKQAVTTLDENDITIRVDETYVLRATVNPSSCPITWESSDPTIATVNNGNIKGIKEGTTTIKANGVECTVHVRGSVPVPDVHVTSVEFDQTTYTCKVGETVTVSAHVLPSDATNKNISYSLGTDAERKATINGAVITAIDVGTITVIATSQDGAKTAQASVIISNQEHEHSFSTDWKCNETKHWHECACGAKSEEADHVFGEDNICDVCEYDKGQPVPHVHTFSTEWTSNDSEHWHEATCGHDVKDGLAAHIDSNKDSKCDVCGHEMPIEPIHAGTENDPYTPEDAALVASGLDETTNPKNPIATNSQFYIKGVVTEMIEEFDAEYGNFSFWFGDRVFEVWRILNGSSKAKFTDGNDILVGDTVTIKAKIMNYKGTPENTTDSYVVKVEREVPGREVTEVLGVKSLPATIFVGETLNPEQVILNVKYNDGSTGVVPATDISLDTSVASESKTGVAYYNDVGHAEFTISVISKGSVVYGTEDNPISVSQALITMAVDCPEDTNLTKQVMYCTGTVKEITDGGVYEQGDNWFQLIVTDGVKDVIVYRIHATDALKDTVKEGAEIKWVGYGKNFKGTLEFVDNGATQCTLLNNGQPIPPAKEIVSVDSVATKPEYLYVGTTPDASKFTLNVTYNDTTTGTVAADRVEVSTAVAGKTIAGTAYYKTFEGVPFTIEVKEKPAPTGEGAVYTFDNENTQATQIKGMTEEKFLSQLVVDGDEIITGYEDATNAYFGGNGGSGSDQWNIWDSLKIGKGAKDGVSGFGTITLKLDSSCGFSGIKVDVIGSRNDGTLTINGITKTVNKKATKDDLNPISLEYDIEGGISELTLSSKDDASGNFGILITRLEFVNDGPVEPEVLEVAVKPSSLTLDLEEQTSAQLDAEVKVKGDAPQTVIWKSSNESVATVVNGLVTAVGEGSATITATSTENDQKFGTCSVTVSAAPVPVTLEKIEATDYTATATVGSTYKFDGVVTAYYSDGNTEELEEGEYTVTTNISTTTAGTKTGVISYEGETCNFTVVVSASSSKIDIELSTTGGTQASEATVNGISGIKAGSKNTAGVMKIVVPKGATKLYFSIAGWKGANVKVSITGLSSAISLNVTSDDGITGDSPYTLVGTASSFEQEIDLGSALAADTTITLTATAGNRFVVWGASYTK